ncbi:MAG: maltose ABC transporter substrate-binding protein [Actinomycetaceae bacterium]|nr:maltose ABC transporter substrate-binding protein [Actinomycetaceae bacterium]
MRRSLAVITAAVLALGLSACGGSDDGAKGPSTDKKEKLGGEITIWGDETRGDIVKALGEKFEADYGTKVNFVQKSNEDLIPEYTKQVNSKSGPDIVINAHDKLGELIKNGVVSPVDIAAVKDKFVPSAVQAVTYDGQTYGVPYAIESVALFRNDDLTKAEPKTWDEMVAAGKESGAQYPFIIQQGPEQGDPYHMYPFQTSFGAPVFKSDDNGYTAELAMNGEEGVKFAEWLHANADILNPNIDGDKAKEEFQNGNAAFTVTGPWNIEDFKKAKINFSVLPVPSAGGKDALPFVGVQTFFLSPESKNKIVATKFLNEFVASEEGQKILYDVGHRLPAMKSVADSIDDPVSKSFSEVAGSGMPMPAIPEMGAVWEFWGSTEANIISGKQTPAEGWKTMNENIEKKIK